jgi:hypothetical protein
MKRAIIAALAALTLSTAAYAGNCTTNTNVKAADVFPELWSPEGANLAGTASCPETDLSETLALSAALSNPVWLESGERFAVSGGLGFADGASAFGATGLVRIEKGISAYGGGAVSTEDSDVWAGKAGLRVGW